MCGDRCVDLTSSVEDCGDCGHSCVADDGLVGLCVDGNCISECEDSSHTFCDGGCTDVLSDNDNCGSCENRCRPTDRCVEGKCEIRPFVVENIDAISAEGGTLRHRVAMVLDDEERLHVTFVERFSDDPERLIYAIRHNDESWTMEVVTEAEDQLAPRIGIVVDSRGDPAISLYDEQIFIATRDILKTGWRLEPVTDVETDDEAWWTPNALAIRSDDSLCMAFGGLDNRVRYAEEFEDGWTFEILEDGPTLGSFGIQVDDADRAHLLYTAEFETGMLGTRLMYTHQNGQGWEMEEIDHLGPIYELHLALDDEGGPHIVFEDTTTWVLYYGRRDESGWYTTPIVADEGWSWGDTPPSEDEFPSIAIDAEGVPHIAYYSHHEKLRYARKVDGKWDIVTVHRGPGGWDNLRYTWPTLALDSQGIPHIVFRSHDQRQLGYATMVVED